jgi:hypothetical protein
MSYENSAGALERKSDNTCRLSKADLILTLTVGMNTSSMSSSSLTRKNYLQEILLSRFDENSSSLVANHFSRLFRLFHIFDTVFCLIPYERATAVCVRGGF